ncbi:MAG: lipopolysaccharide biosynthesis protein [Mucilaginibacter sp.]
MSLDDQKKNSNYPDEISVKDVVAKIASAFRYVRSKWVYILIVSTLGALSGFCYSIFQRPTYTAVCTFVLEETGKGGGLGQYASLASLAGINLGGNGGGIFEGDNILELYKSRLMIEKALLTQGSFNGKNELLIDRYADYNELRSRWKRKDQIDSITFTGDPEKFNRKQDSIITDLVEQFNKKVLNVIKPDKKLSIIDVNVNSKDELFTQAFTNQLVKTVNEFYIQTKTKKTFQNVQILQHQADSVKNVINSSITGVASAIDADPNANPQLLRLRVPSQKKQIDVQASSAVYSEIVKNLEISKISLRQEVPLIQIIDKPVLPLKTDRVGKVRGIIMGFIIGAFLSICVIILSNLYKSINPAI